MLDNRMIKDYVKRTGLFYFYTYLKNHNDYKKWIKKQAGAPPHLVKQGVVKEYRERYETDIFIETGTYYGDMVWAMKNDFSALYSVELSKTLYELALRRFIKNKNVFINYGDSTAVLPKIITGINKPCLFWLDGHYSGGVTAKGNKDTPILEELTCIFEHPVKDHIILIDDARKFNGKDNYPTVPKLNKFITNSSTYKSFDINLDIIRICP